MEHLEPTIPPQGLSGRVYNEEEEKSVAFVHLVRSISSILHIKVSTDSEIKFMVGGILANLDVRGASDPRFHSKKGQYLIASEVMTKKSFLDGEDSQINQSTHRWYQRSRGTQALSTLYAFNCPTFLLTQAHWKLFLENPERNAVFTFPYGLATDQESFCPPCLVRPMDETFIQAIVICLLSNRDALEQEMAKVAEVRASTST